MNGKCLVAQEMSHLLLETVGDASLFALAPPRVFQDLDEKSCMSLPIFIMMPCLVNTDKRVGISFSSV